MGRCTILLALAMPLSCASSDETVAVPPPSSSCSPGQRLLDDSRCLDAGMQANGCSAGELSLDDGNCQPAGVPADACAPGFEAQAAGCVPILPASICHDGWMAVPGESECRPIAPCAPGDWGDIPVVLSANLQPPQGSP